MKKNLARALALSTAMAVSAGFFAPFAPTPARAQTSAAYEAQLREEERQLQAEVEALNKDVTRIQGQKSSIEQAIALIDAEIKALQAKIRLRTLTIEGLTKDIGGKAKTVSELEGKLDRSQASLANLVRRTDQNDAMSLPEILLKGGVISDFFIEVDSFQTLKGSLNSMMDEVKVYKEQTEEEKASLEDRKAKETDARKALEADRKLVDKKKAEQAQLLAIKSGELKTYQQYVSEKQARISQIRSALFDLRGADGIAFGDAYDYAVQASKATGVRPAFILAILQQESDLGKNVGNCLLSSDDGSGVSVNSGKRFTNVMKPNRDVEPFKQITQGLGLDPYATRVSCPLSYGYGGAMGPSQFIPSTWMLFKSRIGKAVGVSADQANPWNPHHAITATAIYLSDLGAGLQTYTSERNAACKYYSGASCGVRTGGTTYGNQVMSRAASIQENMINPILGL